MVRTLDEAFLKKVAHAWETATASLSNKQKRELDATLNAYFNASPAQEHQKKNKLCRLLAELDIDISRHGHNVDSYDLLSELELLETSVAQLDRYELESAIFPESYIDEDVVLTHHSCTQHAQQNAKIKCPIYNPRRSQ